MQMQQSQMQVQVPAGMTEGQMFMIQTPAGGQMQVQVPAGVKGGDMIMVAQPAVAAAVPVANMPQQAGPVGSSQDFLMTMDGLFVRQQLELMEAITGCETKNRYNVTPIPAGTQFPPPGGVNSGWTQGFRAQAGDFPLLKGKEESECFERICCAPFRGFSLPFMDSQGTTFLTIERPCVFDPCYNPPLHACCAQTLTVKNAQGAVISTVEMPAGCCTGGCCAAKFIAKDASGNTLYWLRAAACGTKSGACGNVCAPSCCNEAYDIDVYGPDDKYINTSTFVWPGCNCGGLTDLSNFAIQFPEGSTPEQRSALLAGMMLIEYTVNEMRRQNNNQNGGGGGGAPPKNGEMER